MARLPYKLDFMPYKVSQE